MSPSALSAKGCTAPLASGVVAPFRLQNFGQKHKKRRVISLSIQAKLYFPYVFHFFFKKSQNLIPNDKIKSSTSLCFSTLHVKQHKRKENT
jgi:hypothetical protein